MFFLQLLAKLLAGLSQLLLARSGGTWPGELALRFNPALTKRLRTYFKEVIIILGTNGKTSTSKFVVTALAQSGRQVISNSTGANLENGLVSTVLVKLPFFSKKKQYTAVIEVDEYAFTQIARHFPPDYLIILNLFRDQLDRYGEVGNILSRWQTILKEMPQIKVIYPTSDPALESLFSGASNVRLSYGVPTEFLKAKPGIAGDYVYCQQCGQKLIYQGYYLGHMGAWRCRHCLFQMDSHAFRFSKTQVSKLSFLPDYLIINFQAAFLLLKELSVDETIFWQTIASWQPAFGRGEIHQDKNHKYTFYLGKNPASWSAALKNIIRQTTDDYELIFGLNNRIPDGHDISWIYDADFSFLPKNIRIAVFGDRAHDLAVRLKINGTPAQKVFTSLTQLKQYLQEQGSQIIFLANYSALLETRRLILGRSLL